MAVVVTMFGLAMRFTIVTSLSKTNRIFVGIYVCSESLKQGIRRRRQPHIKVSQNYETALTYDSDITYAARVVWFVFFCKSRICLL